MGVKGLLPCLQSITKQVSLEKYRGLTAAVDAMCWLHKGVFCCDVKALAKYQFLQAEIKDKYDCDSNVNKENTNHCDNGFRSGGEVTHSTGTNEVRRESSPLVKHLNFDQYASTKKSHPQHSDNHRRNNKRHRNRNRNWEKDNTSESFVNAKVAISKCIDYVIRHSELLRKQYGIEVLLVIDGGCLPCKSNINQQRRLDRIQAFEKGLAAEKRGDGREARRQFSRACSISHEMRHELIQQCNLRRIPFVVAPYEADAQVAKLAHNGTADVVISEDSDLLAYACPRVMFKLDFKTGKGDEIQVMRDLAANESLSFRHWSHDMFVYMCILSGCDYCQGVPGIGIQTAHKLVRIHRNPSKIFNALKMGGKWRPNLDEEFWVAYRTFRHQRIYNPERGAIETLFPIPSQESAFGKHNEMWEFLGPWIEPTTAVGIAEGRIHPSKKIPWGQYYEGMILQEEIYNSSNKKSVEKQRNVEGSPSKENLFAFFQPRKLNSIDSKEKRGPRIVNERAPLHEIQVQQDLSAHIIGGGSSAPSNAHDYSSSLVAASFKPLTRKHNPIHASQRRRSASKAFKKLKNRLSLKKVIEREKEKITQNAALRNLTRATTRANEMPFGEQANDTDDNINTNTTNGIFKKKIQRNDYLQHQDDNDSALHYDESAYFENVECPPQFDYRLDHSNVDEQNELLPDTDQFRFGNERDMNSKIYECTHDLDIISCARDSSSRSSDRESQLDCTRNDTGIIFDNHLPTSFEIGSTLNGQGKSQSLHTGNILPKYAEEHTYQSESTLTYTNLVSNQIPISALYSEPDNGNIFDPPEPSNDHMFGLERGDMNCSGGFESCADNIICNESHADSLDHFDYGSEVSIPQDGNAGILPQCRNNSVREEDNVKYSAMGNDEEVNDWDIFHRL